MPLLRLFSRDGAAATAATGAASSSSLPLGAIIAIVVVGTLFLAGAGGLTCAWISRCNRRKRRLHIVQQEEDLRQKEMMAISMMRDDNNLVPSLGANGQAKAKGATATASGPVAYTALSDCGSSTCCSLASSFGTAEYEGSGLTWWWRYRWRQMRSGSNTKKGVGNYGSGSGHNCPHGHDHLSHHRRQVGNRTGPRKLQRRRPETSIIASTNSLFFPAFGESNHNDVNNHSNTQLNVVHVPGSDSISHHNNYKHPQRPPPPADQQRLLTNGQNGQKGQTGPSQNMRYHPQQHQQGQRPVSLQPTPQNTSRSLPRPPQPALIIPDRPNSQTVQNMPAQFQLTDQQRHMLMVQQQHLQQQMAYYQQQINLQQQHQQQLQQEQQRRGYKSLPQNFATDSALSEILRSTEKRLQQLQAEPESGLGGFLGDDSLAKRVSITSGSSNDEADSPILDAIPTPLSSPSKSPRKISGASQGTHNGITPAISLPPPATSTATNSSPDTRSSVYSSSPASPASSRSSSLSTVYSADERDALASITDGPFASKGMAGLGITGANVPEDNDMEDKMSTLASRRARRMSLSVNTNINANNVHIPNPPPRSPKRSPHRSAIVSSSMVMMGGGVNIPHGIVAAGQNQNNSFSHGSPTKRNNANNKISMDRPQLMNNSGIRSSFGPNRYVEAAGSSSDDSDNQKEDDDLLPRHANVNANAHTSWGSQTSTASYKQSQAPQGPRAEPTGTRRPRQEPSDALRAVEAEQAMFRQSVKALPKPQPQQTVPQLTVGNLAAGHRSTVVAIAADLRRMNSTAYSEASSCYSNATTATSVASGQPGSLAVPRNGSRLSGHGGRSHRRRNSTGADSIVGVTTDAGPRASVGSRQYLALGTKHMSMMAPEKENLGLNLGQGQSQQRMSYDALTTLAHAAAASNAPPVSSAPRRARSKRAMTIATTGTTLLRVDENPGSGASTPRHTPKKTPHATPKDTPTKANMGKLLVKSPSKGSFVGSVEPSASSPLRKNKSLAPGSGPSTPSKSKRDSLGLYDQEGFLLSSPFRGKQEKQEM